MGWLGGRGKRREPRMKDKSGGRLDLRLSAGDRAGGAPQSGRRKSREEPAPKKRGGARRRGPFRRLFYWMFVLALWGGFAAAGLIGWQFTKLPPIQTLVVPKRPPS
ncbi:MAG: penicillin-binding protein, partial [Rhodoblastus sp.]|nr:penicillin-binding protein [Rhodoblastus sp.]